ncbi:hypothetical protein JOQ06_007031 [Pogonophryne albipinna]|uniref:Uncharacterized protein n=1 Tax=Pogonophryne albipinna TaxID=1090488 RepID=A0AAD6AZ63_9TELE|nr:hypothetical protein JOQ06_007031 [Pogonophryne albipinna]
MNALKEGKQTFLAATCTSTITDYFCCQSKPVTLLDCGALDVNWFTLHQLFEKYLLRQQGVPGLLSPQHSNSCSQEGWVVYWTYEFNI